MKILAYFTFLHQNLKTFNFRFSPMHFEFTLITLYLLILSSTITKKTSNELEYNLKLSPTLLKYHPLTFIENISIQHPTIIYNWLTHVRVRKQSSTVMSYRLLLILLMIGVLKQTQDQLSIHVVFVRNHVSQTRKLWFVMNATNGSMQSAWGYQMNHTTN